MSSPPTNQVVNATARGKEKAVTTKRSRKRQASTPYTLTDANQHPPRTRRRAPGICRDVRELKPNPGVPQHQWIDKFEGAIRGDGGEMEEVVRTEACSPALSALVMATARHKGSEGQWASQGPLQSHQNGLCSSLHSDLLSVHQAPWLQYPIPSSIPMSPPSQDQPMTTDARLWTIGGLLSHPTRSLSRASHPLHSRHRSLQPLSLSPPSTAYPPRGSSSMRLTPPRSSFLARSLSWIQCPSAPFTGQAASAFASRPDPAVPAFQAPYQDGYTMDYSHPNRMYEPRSLRRAFPLTSNTIPSAHPQQPLTAYTEDYHHLSFDPGQQHMDHPPSLNSYSSPTSTLSFTSVYPCTPSTSTGDGAGQ